MNLFFKVNQIAVVFFLFSFSCFAQPIFPGAEKVENYITLLKNKRVGVFANQTSLVGKTHLIDTLKNLGVDIKIIFGPEHGFRGTADAGEKVGNYVDENTGIPVISLYGSKRKPSAEDLKDIDILVFDIQDVGVRFYTFISSLQEFMEAAIEFKKPLLILDRPNPNGHYVDGPILDKKYKSFVGMQPIPIVYGMTIAEYATMILKEGWLSVNNISAKTILLNNKINSIANESLNNQFVLFIAPCENYTHKSKYVLPVKPSPNLPNIQSIYLYPSTCLFEGTVLSEGRGTNKQFQIFGHTSLPQNLISFIPMPNEGAKNSKLFGQTCYGWDLSGSSETVFKKVNSKIQLKWLLEAYRLFPEKDKFFILPKSGKMEESFFTKLAGNNLLWQQIKEGKTEKQIRKTWINDLENFKQIRTKYLFYPS